MFTLVVLIVTIVVCLSHVCFGHFKYLSAHNYKVRLVRRFRSGVAQRLTSCSVSDRHQGDRPGGCGKRTPCSALLFLSRQVSGEPLPSGLLEPMGASGPPQALDQRRTFAPLSFRLQRFSLAFLARMHENVGTSGTLR